MTIKLQKMTKEVNKSKTNSEDPFNDIADNNEKNEKSKESNGDKMTQDDDDITENDDKMAESEGEDDDGITENGKTSRNSVNGCDSNKNGGVNEHSQEESERTKESGNNDVLKNKASPDDPLNFNNDQNKGSKSIIKEQNNDKNGENEDDIAKNDDTVAENDSVTPNIDENDDDIAKDDNDVTKNDNDITENDNKMAESEGENDDGVTEENGTG